MIHVHVYVCIYFDDDNIDPSLVLNYIASPTMVGYLCR